MRSWSAVAQSAWLLKGCEQADGNVYPCIDGNIDRSAILRSRVVGHYFHVRRHGTSLLICHSFYHILISRLNSLNPSLVADAHSSFNQR